MDILKVFAGMVLVGAVGIVGTFYTMKFSDWVRACLWERKRRKSEAVRQAVIAAFKAQGFEEIRGPEGVTLMRERVLVVTPDRPARDLYMEAARDEIREMLGDL